jgi:hypothetical protein
VVERRLFALHRPHHRFGRRLRCRLSAQHHLRHAYRRRVSLRRRPAWRLRCAAKRRVSLRPVLDLGSLRRECGPASIVRAAARASSGSPPCDPERPALLQAGSLRRLRPRSSVAMASRQSRGRQLPALTRALPTSVVPLTGAGHW